MFHFMLKHKFMELKKKRYRSIYIHSITIDFVFWAMWFWTMALIYMIRKLMNYANWYIAHAVRNNKLSHSTIFSVKNKIPRWYRQSDWLSCHLHYSMPLGLSLCVCVCLIHTEIYIYSVVELTESCWFKFEFTSMFATTVHLPVLKWIVIIYFVHIFFNIFILSQAKIWCLWHILSLGVLVFFFFFSLLQQQQ